MSSWIRLIIGLLLAPAVPALVLIVGSLPSGYQTVLPLAQALLLYGYISALVAAPILVIFRGQFSRKPVAVIPLAGVIGALAAASPFIAAAFSGEVSASDWPSFIALVPLLGIGGVFGMLSGVIFWLIARPIGLAPSVK